MNRILLVAILPAIVSCSQFSRGTSKAPTVAADENKRNVEAWLHRNLGDPSGMEIVEWGPFEDVQIIEGTIDMSDVKRESRERFDQAKPPSFIDYQRKAAEHIAEREREGKSKTDKEWLAEHNRIFSEEYKKREAEWNAENERTRVERLAEFERRKANLPRSPGILGDVTYRARNAFGGKVLSTMAFVIRDGQICAELSSSDADHFRSTAQARGALREQAEGGRWVKTVP